MPSKLIIKSDKGDTTIIQTNDAAYWALRARLINNQVIVRYENKGKNCAGFWPLPFKKVGLRNA